MTTINETNENLTPTAKREFDPTPYLTDIKGKPYLEVKYRILWFKMVHPDGEIFTTIENTDPVIVRAIITVDGQSISTGHAMAVSNGREIWSGREVEKAETAAIGRALAHAGFGTQFTGESEIDDNHIADTPGNATPKPSPAPVKPITRPLPPETVKKMIADKASKEYNDKTASPTFRGFIAGHLTTACGDDDDRYAVTLFLAGHPSIKDVPDAMVFAIRDWLGLNNAKDVSADAVAEINLIKNYIVENVPATDDEILAAS